jgi:uncharacterized protein YecT (DUF1311 family)
MQRIGRYLSIFLMNVCLVAPVALQAAPATQSTQRATEAKNDKRYYDNSHKDYHVWNDRENEAYRHWMDEKHQNYREFSKLKSKQQQDYWAWRHDHPENDRH